MSKSKISAERILDILQGEQTLDVLWFPEMRLGSGWDGVASRRIDLLKVETAPSRGHTATIHEIKISRADFRKDLKQPKKQRGARLFADFFYYVTPPGLIKPEEVPVWAGLIEIDPDKTGAQAIRRIIEAPRLDKERPTWGFLIAACRNISGWSKENSAAQKVHELNREISRLEMLLQIRDYEIQNLREAAKTEHA